MIVVLHPGIVNDSGPGSHGDGDLLLLAAELGYPGAAVDAGSGSVVKGGDPYEAGILARSLEVLEVVRIDDRVNGRDRADSHHA